MDSNNAKKVALVLSGGGIKAAAYHVGVCFALRENGFVFAGGAKGEFDFDAYEAHKTIKLYVGSSAGSIISTFLAAGHSLENIVDAFQISSIFRNKKKFSTARRGDLKPITYKDIFHFNSFKINSLSFRKFLPASVSSMPIVSGGIEALIKYGFKWNGLFSTSGIEQYIRQHVVSANQFKDLEAELFIIGTQLNHSRKVIFGDFEQARKNSDTKWANFASISQAVAASASLPPVFAPYGIHNNKGKEIFFFDGEIRDTLSTHVASDMGADLVISSYSIQPYHFNKQIGSLHKYGIPVILNQALYQVVQQKIAAHIKNKTNVQEALEHIDKILTKENTSEELKFQLKQKISEIFNYNPNVKNIYIHPHANNHEMFFADHFSLNPDILRGILKCGYRNTVEKLRQENLC